MKRRSRDKNRIPRRTQITRRTFMRGAAAGTLAIVCANRFERPAAAGEDRTIGDIRAATLRYIDNMRFRGRPAGRYRYSADMSEPTLYSSTYAAMTRSLYRDLDSLEAGQRDEWIEYFQSHQESDGLYADPQIAGAGWYQGDPEWCGRRHLTCHVVSALACLGAAAARPLRCLEPFYRRSHLIQWLESREWEQKADFAGNEVLNIGTLLQYARDFQRESRAAAAVRAMLDWLSDNHVSPETGLWGGFNTATPRGLSRAVMGAYHFWLLYFYDRAPIPHAERAIDHVLRTENPAGGFGWGEHGPTSSACEDIDSIDPLVRLYFLWNYRREDIRRALSRAVPHVLSNQNDDGGFAFVRGKEFSYGHPLLSSTANGSGMFPTWFRTLSLAYLGKALSESPVGFDWDFRNSPGIQFWLDY